MSVTYRLVGGPQGSGCQHKFTRIERMPEGFVHHSKEVCQQCGRVLRWVPDPRNVERRKLLCAYVARLLTAQGLTRWEKGFVDSLRSQAKFSPRQEEVLGNLYRRYFGGPAL
jgi:hypothetical protein